MKVDVCERTQGFAADPVYVKGEVFAYVGLSQNLKDLKDVRVVSGATHYGERNHVP